MYDDTTRTTFDNTNPDVLSQIPTGTTVYDTNGEKVGSVADYDSRAGYMVVEKGWLFHTDLYVPLTLISNTDDQGIYLKVTKDDLKADQYTNPPTGYALDNTSPTAYDTTDPQYAGTGTTGYGSVSSRDVAATTGGYTGQVSDVQNQDLGAGTVGADQASPASTINYAGQPSTQNQGTGTTSWNNQTAADIQVPVREEELVAGTRVVEEGRVRVHKEVVEEQETITVPVQRERVVVERVPATGEVAADTLDASAFKEDDIEIPLKREEAVVGKRVQGVENVRIHKDVVTDNEQVGDTVRKERVVVDGADTDDFDDQTDANTYRR
jgi:uncharacterized protein (TIGR02271 family)